MEEQARLVSVENDREVTRAGEPRFWYEYQRSILLALKEKGVLNDRQYGYAEEKLNERYRTGRAPV